MATDTTVEYEVQYDVLEEECKAFESSLRPRLKQVLSVEGVNATEILKEEKPMRPTVVFVLGGPGAGKGTQCANIVEKYGYTHISAGDCLRAERASGSADADLINSFIKDGKIVPVEITIKLVLKAMEESGNSKFLIDGFPRDGANLEGWFRIVGDAVNVAFVLHFDCPEDVMLTRLLKRGESSGRVDDNISSIRKRFLTYHESTAPVIHAFEAEGKVRVVNADRPVELVFLDVKRIFDTLEFARRPRVHWTIRYATTPDSLDNVALTSDELGAELHSEFGAALKSSTRVLHKVVDEEKAAEGSCVIC